MALKTNLIIDQGSTFQTTILVTDQNGTPIDLTNYTAASQIRKHFTSTSSVSFTATTGGVAGTITLGLTAAQTANLEGGRYVFDVELYTSNNSIITRVIEGIVTVNPNVTRL